MKGATAVQRTARQGIGLMRWMMLAGLALAAAGISGAAGANPASIRGDGRATEYSDCADAPCRIDAVQRLKDAARAGGNFALIRLEQLRAAGAPNAPGLDDIISIEIARAERGDAVTAWRLARRYETGDGVKSSAIDMVRWLKVAASEDPDIFPKAADAAYRLCEIHGQDAAANASEARFWCREAAGAGHAGAVMVIARLRDR
jgi:TPR repeat protein